MKTPTHRSREFLARRIWLYHAVRQIVLSVVVLLPLLAWSIRAAPFSDDFNDGNDVGWTQKDPLSILGPSGTGTYSFPGGNTYRFQHAPTPLSDYGTARMSSLPTDLLSGSSFQMSVDVLSFGNFGSATPALQAFGLLVHGSDIDIGTSKGIALVYENLAPLAPIVGQPYTDHITITRVINEQLAYMSGNMSTNDGAAYNGESSAMVVSLSPAAAHRLVLLGNDQRYEARVYQLPDLTKPIALCTATNKDPLYLSPQGVVGITAFNYAGLGGLFTGPVDVTFDNFYFDNSVPVGPAPSLAVSTASGTTTVSWPGEIPGIWELETSPELGAGAVWTTLPLWEIKYDGVLGKRTHVPAPGTAGYYRLRKL